MEEEWVGREVREEGGGGVGGGGGWLDNGVAASGLGKTYTRRCSGCLRECVSKQNPAFTLLQLEPLQSHSCKKFGFGGNCKVRSQVDLMELGTAKIQHALTLMGNGSELLCILLSSVFSCRK